MSKGRPPTYELRKQGCTTGVVGAGSDEGGGRSGVPLLALSDQRKKVTKTVHFSLENFAK